MVSSTPECKRSKHQRVWRALNSFNARLLTDTCCYFGGGTRIVLGLGEYRESADVDFLCADGSGYRRLRNTISQNSLGDILTEPIALLREVRADRYGIRTFLDLDGEPVKFEIITEGRILIDPDPAAGLPVPALDPVSCFAEKFLANADRWADRSVLSRDIIDLAFMIKGWGNTAALAGLDRAIGAYGDVVVDALSQAIIKLEEDPGYFHHCLGKLAVSDSRGLRSRLRMLSEIIG